MSIDPFADLPFIDVEPPEEASADPADPAPGHATSQERPARTTPAAQHRSAAGEQAEAGGPSRAEAVKRAKLAALRGILDGAGTGLRDEAEAALRELVGDTNAALREDQWTAIEALTAYRRRALVVQRTGWGKSAVYFVATKLLRARGAGPTVIISPLLALMRDQIAAASRAGITAVTINSANVTQWEEIHARVAAGDVDVLLCSPERLNNPGFRDDVLPRLASDAGLVVIDEAHCVSDWGHDFRPDYRRIRTLLTELPPGIPVLATTATANTRVTADIAEQLTSGSHDDPAEEVLVLRGSLNRTSLHLAVLDLPDQPTRIAWLTEALGEIDGSGIVYCLTVAAAEQVAAALRAAGLAVASYTGQTDPAQREQLEADLKDNRVKALIATSALGMGFDKPDLAFVVHLGAPASPIAYYQHVGRAGRGVDRAVVVLLPGAEDSRIWDYFDSLSFPDEAHVRATLAALEASGEPLSVGRLETAVELKRSRLEMMLKVLDVDGVVRRVTGGWTATGKPWTYDGDRYARVARTRHDERAAMVDYQRTAGCRMAFLRAALDDPELAEGWACGQCDRCGGVQLPSAPDPDAITVARTQMDRPGSEITARKVWPTGMDRLDIPLTGKIPPAEIAAPGRAIARLDGLGWSAPLRALFAPDAPDGPTPPALRTAATRVLDDWLARNPGEAHERRPHVDGVIAIRSASRPQLTHHLSTGLARYLGVPFVGALGPDPVHLDPGRHDINSAMRLAAVHRRLRVELSPAALSGLTGRAVLLVDDYTDSGWTLTVAARLLRIAGASAVYPFVLGVR